MAVLDLGRHQQRNGRVLNGGTPFEILETDIVGRDFVDSFEVHGVGLGEAFGGLGPVRSGCDCVEAFTGTVWKSGIVNSYDAAGVPSPFSDSTKDRVVKREWHDRRSDGWVARFVCFLT
jgi:hypothetical protein